MSRKSNNKKVSVRKPKARNWLAVHAHFRSGAGAHGTDGKKPKYSRKSKHRVRYE